VLLRQRDHEGLFEFASARSALELECYVILSKTIVA
jgi:hypothetical protein